MLHYYNLQLYLRLELKPKNTSRIRIKPITMAKTIYWIQHLKENRSRKRNGKHGKAWYKLMNNAVYGKLIENLINRINAKFVSNKKDYLKWTSKPSYMSQNIWQKFGGNS